MFGSTWGQNNQQQQQQQPQQSGGLFGSSSGTGFGQTAGGFGQQQTAGGFGQQLQQQQSTGGGLFGASSATNTGGFGGFGQTAQQPQQQQSNAFGAARPSFGATGTAPFGSTTANTGGGLFGSSNTNTSFGASNTASTSGGLFGAPKPATGFGASSSGGLFGAPKPATGFGSSPATGGFGAPASNATFGVPSTQVHQYATGPPAPIPQTGTQAPVYQPTWQRDPPASTLGKEMPPHLFHVISAMDPYKGGSFEELRMLDYQQGRKEPSAQPQPQQASTGFVQPAATGGFGQPAATSGFGQPAATNAFGAPKPAGLFGSTSATPAFGQAQTSSTGVFGQQQAQPSTGFGQPAASSSTGGLFGQSSTTQPASTGGIFGNSNPFGQNNQQQQQPTANTGFGGFGAAKPATPFGQSSTGATGGFGQPAATSSPFGQTNTASTGGFGGFGQQQNQQQQQPAAGGGLFGGGGFGQNNTQTNTGSSLFGQNNQQQQPAAGGLFGATAPKPATSLFGATPAANTTTGGFGGFGQASATPATQPSTGLFGQQNNAASTTGSSLFGAQQQQQPAPGGSLFGASSTSGGLFGAAKPAAPAGGLFGAAPATQPAPTTSLFGQQQQSSTPSTGLFGQQNTTAKPAGSLFGGGSSLFGASAPPAQPAATGGMFGGLGQSQPASTGLFGSTAQPAQQSTLGQSGGLFGSLNQSQQQQQQQQPSLTASLDQNPYGRSELFTYNGQKLELGSTNKKPALPPITNASYRVTPAKGRVPKLRGFASPLSASTQSPGRSSSPALASPSRSLLGSPQPSDRYRGLTDSALSPNAFIPRPNVMKITVAPAKANGSSDDPLESVLGKSALRSSANGFSSPAQKTPELFTSARSPALPAVSNTPIEDTPTRRPQPAPVADAIRVPVSDRPLKRGDYWCRPKLEKLRQMSHEELTHIENFTAGRKGYGEVTFQEPVDLTGLPSLQDLLGKTIVVEDLELSVYPDERAKPARGKGLNVPAIISLENVFARDKATRQPITDSKDPRYQRQIKRVKAVRDTEFINFSDEGVWTFRVEHFSRYGLNPSDDEESDEGMEPAKELTPSESEEEDFLPPTKSYHDVDMETDHDSAYTEDDESFSDEMNGDFDNEDEDNVAALQADWDRPMKNKLGAEGMRKLREMQSSFFGAQESKAPRLTAQQSKKIAAMEAVRALERKRTEAGFGSAEETETRLDNRAVKRASFGEPRLPLLRKPRKYAKVPLAESTVDGNEGVRVDAGLALGRSFRCSWGPNGEIVHFGKICASGTKFQSTPDATVYLQQVDLLSESEPVERHSAERLLNLLLEQTEVVNDNGVPVANTAMEIRFSDFAALFDAADRSQEASAFRLGHALFDEIDLRLPDDTPEEVRQNVAEARRKLALSKWLEDAVAPAVDDDLAKSGDNRPAKVFALLTGNQLDRAVQSALDAGDMRLATLVSQAGSSEAFRDEVARQLDDWSKYKADSLIDYDYRKLYALLAGITDISEGDSSRGQDNAPDVLVAEGLDWKRAFGLQLWHGCPFELDIADILQAYDNALQSDHPPAKPLPPYLEKPSTANRWILPSQPTDVLYNLIKMYADLTMPLDDVLGARDSSPSPTDFRLPWHLQLLLAHALRKRDFADREDEENVDGIMYSATANRITRSYAAQLEVEGLWTWAAYVLLHLELPEAREASVKELLFRHPQPTPAEQDFLLNKLQVPQEWMHLSRAAKLAYAGDAYGEFHELIAAGEGDRAQRILIAKLAPEAVLRDDKVLLERLCTELEPLRPNGWEYGGKLYLEYLAAVQRVHPLLASYLRSGGHPDAAEAAELSRLAQGVPRLLKLLPGLFPDADDVQQVASLSDMLSSLMNLAVALHPSGFIDRPAVSEQLADKDRLYLLQTAASESFENSLRALTA